MSTLQLMLKEQNEILEALVEGEDESAHLEALNRLSVDMPAKIDGYKLFMDRLEAEAEFLEARAEEFKTAAKSLQNAYTRLKEHLKTLMISSNIDELSGNDFQFKISKTKGSVIVSNQDLLPKEYVKEILSISVDKVKISQDLNAGLTIPGAFLQESFRLSSSVKKSTKKPKKESNQ